MTARRIERNKLVGGAFSPAGAEVGAQAVGESGPGAPPPRPCQGASVPLDPGSCSRVFRFPLIFYPHLD